MKVLGFVFVGIGVVFLLIHLIFEGNTYFVDNATVVHNSLPIGASFVIGAGVALLLADMNIRKKDRKRRDDIKPGANKNI